MLLCFKERFTDSIISGTKIFTVRDQRKHEPKTEEVIYMYTGLRTKSTKLISKKFKYSGTQAVCIVIDGKENVLDIQIKVDNRILSKFEVDDFIIKDGFANSFDFADYWIKSQFKNMKAAKATFIRVEKTIYHWTNFRF